MYIKINIDNRLTLV